MSEITYREALQQAMREEMRRDDSVFVMGEEIGRVTITPSKVTEGLFQEFGPKRVRDTPIAEEGFVGAAIGAAMLGLRPVVEIMTLNFILVAMDQVINHAAKVRYMFGGEAQVPLVIRTPGGGGGQLTAQHSQSFEVWFASTPGLKVLAPATPADAKGLLKSAIRDDDPVLFLESLPLYATRGEVPDGDYTTPIGVANVLRQGTDLTIVSHSFATLRAMRLANRLAQEGIEAEVVDLRSLRPFDMETVAASVRKTHRALCIEEGWPTYGVTAELAARIHRACFADLDAPVERVGGAEVPMPYARPLERTALVNDDKIYQAAQDLLRESGMLSRGVGGDGRSPASSTASAPPVPSPNGAAPRAVGAAAAR
jgi:pyruvate dehydrogenase E1 component beta subunit